MNKINHHQTRSQKRKTRVRSKITGTATRPRLSVFRSNQHFHVQLIDDQAQKTLLGMSTTNLKTDDLDKTQQAQKLGEKFAKKAQDKGIKQATLDRGPYQFHGRLKAFTQAAREAGLKI